MSADVRTDPQLDPQPSTVMLNGLSFQYLDWGNSSAQALICLHGFTGHARTWDTFARAMRQDYRVLALDQRGHGGSQWATDYSPERRVEDLEAFVASLGLARFVLLGLSMGGVVAFTYAATHPGYVDRLVVVDIAPEVDPRGSARIAASVTGKDIFADPEEAIAAARTANGRPPDAELRHRVVHNLVQLDDGTWTFRYDVALRNGTLPRPARGAAETEALWASLAAIDSPTLVIRGAQSDLLSPLLARRLQSSIPVCQLVEVPDAGHSVPLDNPSGFLDATRPFLAPRR